MTNSIRLLLLDADLGAACANDPATFQRQYGASLGQHVETVREVVSRMLALVLRVPRAAEFGGYLAVDPRQRVVGTCGFKHGQTRRGEVEIAYFTFPEFQSQGIGTAMARALVEIAQASPDVRLPIAYTLPKANHSTRILTRLGFQHVGAVEDPEDGTIWRWELLAN